MNQITSRYSDAMYESALQEKLSLKQLTRSEWDILAPRFSDLSDRQCGSYSERAARTIGAECEFVGVFDADQLIGLANVRIKKLPFIPLGVAYVNYGPLTVRNKEFMIEPFALCLCAIAQEYVHRRRLMLRVAPPLSGGHWQPGQLACFESQSFFATKRGKPTETFILDLAKPVEEIRRHLDGKWRSDLSKAERSNVQVIRTSSPSDFDIFEPLFNNLVERKNFSVPQDLVFFREVQQKAQPYEQFVLHLAWHNNEVIAGHLGSFVGDTATYLLGATNSKGRELRASFLLQWAVIQYAQSIGKTFYDLGGIDLQNNPNVYRFKQRINGRHAAEIGPYEFAPSSLTRAALAVIEQAYARRSAVFAALRGRH